MEEKLKCEKCGKEFQILLVEEKTLKWLCEKRLKVRNHDSKRKSARRKVTTREVNRPGKAS